MHIIGSNLNITFTRMILVNSLRMISIEGRIWENLPIMVHLHVWANISFSSLEKDTTGFPFWISWGLGCSLILEFLELRLVARLAYVGFGFSIALLTGTRPGRIWFGGTKFCGFWQKFLFQTLEGNGGNWSSLEISLVWRAVSLRRSPRTERSMVVDIRPTVESHLGCNGINNG